MDAYAHLMKFQAEMRLEELRRQAAHDRLVRSVRRRRRSLVDMLRRRPPAPVRPVIGLPGMEPEGQLTRRVA